MRDYPASIVETDRIEPAPRRVRGMLGSAVVFDTIRAVYVWEHPHFPQYYIPYADIDRRYFIDEAHSQHLSRGTARRHGLRADDIDRPGTAWLFGRDALEGLDGYVRFDWAALDAWYEEDEEIFVHPRDPYKRVDVLDSSRSVQVVVGGQVVAETRRARFLFETRLPTRYYIPQEDVRMELLVPSEKTSACPYKGRTTGYWTVEVKGQTYPDLAWTYDFPTRQMLPIAGLIAFYNEKVDIYLDGVLLDRPQTPFS